MRDERDVIIPSETMRQFTERATKEQAGIFLILLQITYFNNFFFYIL